MRANQVVLQVSPRAVMQVSRRVSRVSLQVALVLNRVLVLVPSLPGAVMQASPQAGLRARTLRVLMVSQQR